MLGDVSEKDKVRYARGIVLGSIAICSLALFIFPNLEREGLPKVDQGEFLVQIDMPPGTRLSVTDRVCRALEERLREFKEVKDTILLIPNDN